MIGTVGKNCTNAATLENAENCQRYRALGGGYHVVSGALVDFDLQRLADARQVSVQIIDRQQCADGVEIFGDFFSQRASIETIQAVPCQQFENTRELGLAE